MSYDDAFPIIAKLGGSDAVYRHLNKAFGITTRDALRMWRTRRQIPARHVLELMRLAQTKGVSYGPNDFQLTQAGAEETNLDAA